MSTLDFDPFPAIDRGTPGEYSRVWAPVQREIAARVVVAPLDPLPRFVAGADCAFSKDGQSIHAVALVWDREERRLVEVTHATRAVTTPYVSGFLSFREGPAILDAIGKLKQSFGVVTFDGQGIAHPRRCGLATHLGVVLDVPSVGVAKSHLIGKHDDVGEKAGSTATLVDRGESIGVVLRTRDGVRPLFVSVGHRCDIDSAVRLALSCVTRYRVPEPTRVADIEVAKYKASLTPSPFGRGLG
jgi:deoxyribonuclease V